MDCLFIVSEKKFHVVSIVFIFSLFLYVYLTGDPSRFHHGGRSKPLPAYSRGENATQPDTAAADGNSSSSSLKTGINDVLNESVSMKRRGYMFPLRLPEQLTMATAHFHQFQNLVNDWGFTGVEPFAYGSTMFGLKSLHPSFPNRSVPLSTLFNASIHNDYLSKCMKREPDPETGYPVLFEPTREFLRRSYRKIVFVYFAAHYHLDQAVNNEMTRKTVEREINRQNSTFMDCSSAARTHGMSKRVEDLLAKEIAIEKQIKSTTEPLPNDLEAFKVTQAFCVKNGNKISLRDLRDFVLVHIHKEGGARIEVSIIFISWQGRFTHPLVDSDVNNYINLCRIPFSEPFHSDYILKTTERYLNSLDLHGQPYISVHIRFEKLFYFVFEHGRASMDGFVNCCMNRLNMVLSAVAEKFNITSQDNILVNWDYSPYGSMEYPIRDTVQVARKHLKKVNGRPVYFDPKKFGVTAEHNIVSLVEMNALLKGNALVTVGGGSYQHTIAQTFLEHHRNPDDPEAAELLHYGHLCIPNLEKLHGLSLPPTC